MSRRKGDTGAPLIERLCRRSRQTEGGCWEWTGRKNNKGYGVIRHGDKTILAHRAAYELTHGFVPVGMNVLHRCDNPPCWNPQHLFSGTQSDNALDAITKGRLIPNPPDNRGSRNGMSRLTETDVRAIRARLHNGERPTALAREFGVTYGSINDIQARRRWKHVV